MEVVEILKKAIDQNASDISLWLEVHVCLRWDNS